MECKEYQDKTKEQYEKISGFNSRSDLLFVLINTLLHIVYNGYYYCFCRERLPIKCRICKVSEIFVDFEVEIKEKKMILNI